MSLNPVIFEYVTQGSGFQVVATHAPSRRLARLATPSGFALAARIGTATNTPLSGDGRIADPLLRLAPEPDAA